MMKKHIMAAAAAVTLSSLVAGPAVQAQEVTGSLGADVTSAYIFRGATINDEVNVQPYLEASVYGVTFGTWANFNTDSEQFDEIDYYVGYDIPMPEDTPVGISLGYCEYTYPTAVTTVGTNSVGLEADREISLGLSLDTILAPSIGFYYGVDGGIEESLYIEGGISHSIEVTEDLTIDAGAVLGYVEPDEGESGFSHCTVSVGAGVGPAYVSVGYVIETDDEVLVVDEDFFVTVGVGI